MKTTKRLASALLAAALALSFTACSGKPAENSSSGEGGKTVVKIGVVGENSEQWEPVKAALAADNIEIELVKFSEYSLPNQALADGDIDLNSFQHYAFLNKEIEEKNLDLTVIGETIIAPLGIYSVNVQEVSQVKEGDKVAIPSDATNGGRALKLLESAGLLKMDPEVGYLGTKADIVENPLNLDIYEVEAAQTPSLLPDVAIAVINGGHAVDAGLIPAQDAIFLESTDSSETENNPFINVIVARTADKDDEVYKKVVDAYHTDAVAKVIEETYKGSYLPAWTNQ